MNTKAFARAHTDFRGAGVKAEVGTADDKRCGREIRGDGPLFMAATNFLNSRSIAILGLEGPFTLASRKKDDSAAAKSPPEPSREAPNDVRHDPPGAKNV